MDFKIHRNPTNEIYKELVYKWVDILILWKVASNWTTTFTKESTKLSQN